MRQQHSSKGAVPEVDIYVLDFQCAYPPVTGEGRKVCVENVLANRHTSQLPNRRESFPGEVMSKPAESRTREESVLPGKTEGAEAHHARPRFQARQPQQKSWPMMHL